ncbi:unnamed protein product [Cuscuta epithymum]|uniref:Uncharacterized protein n=1 Tax=Cuscuta epithymum TaxID=186058 RepID=A0AAV0GJD5_9ASTE|nr:unnamed protein product [Cuscuta epithymum]CAH9147708.1 unnamed protein product [Cuscuta epithymum]
MSNLCGWIPLWSLPDLLLSFFLAALTSFGAFHLFGSTSTFSTTILPSNFTSKFITAVKLPSSYPIFICAYEYAYPFIHLLVACMVTLKGVKSIGREHLFDSFRCNTKRSASI